MFSFNNNVALTQSQAVVIFSVIDYTTWADFKSPLIDFLINRNEMKPITAVKERHIHLKS